MCAVFLNQFLVYFLCVKTLSHILYITFFFLYYIQFLCLQNWLFIHPWVSVRKKGLSFFILFHFSVFHNVFSVFYYLSSMVKTFFRHLNYNLMVILYLCHFHTYFLCAALEFVCNCVSIVGRRSDLSLAGTTISQPVTAEEMTTATTSLGYTLQTVLSQSMNDLLCILKLVY